VTTDNALVTPALNVLPGVTRMKLIEAAKKEFIVEERVVFLTEIREAKEAFVTSTTKQILPVAGIDEVVFKQTKISNHLRRLFRSTYNC
jgi:branched-subunit amino acid aminotransferase/4-amino-4-deoxychorismate lyase